MEKEIRFLKTLVKDASKLITDEFEVRAKDDKGDLVTNFDYEIERYMIDKIKEEYPNFDIISEEFNTDGKLTENCFVIDPIDGTVNFAHGLPLWGIQIACIKDNETVASVIYLPKLDEFYYADETGAYLNDSSISVNKFDKTKGLYTIDGPGKLPTQIKMREINALCRDFCSAAVNFAWVASGKLSATNFVWDTVWDYIPGMYLVKQAGGVIYNESKCHIAANSEEFLNMMKENVSDKQ